MEMYGQGSCYAVCITPHRVEWLPCPSAIQERAMILAPATCGACIDSVSVARKRLMTS